MRIDREENNWEDCFDGDLRIKKIRRNTSKPHILDKLTIEETKDQNDES